VSGLVVIDHPLIAHKLSLMRSKATPSAQFRTLLREISMLLGYEVLRDLPTELRDIETPVGPMRAPFLKGKKLVFVPILREDIGERLTVVVDPMLATGNSAVAALARLKARGARDMRLVCLLAAPEGVAEVARAHPDVRVFTAALDERLNDHGYIVPGLGDAGDRLYGTK
jgi:uracil phosphoribosyltransferase